MPLFMLLIALLPAHATGAPPAPLFTGHARAPDNVEVNLRVDVFEGMELQEATDFDGLTTLAQVTLPTHFDRVRFRVMLPLYTVGDAVLIKAGDEPGEIVGAPTHIHGFGGVHDFVTGLLDYQLITSQDERGHVSVSGGAGVVVVPLSTTFGDRYNHQGNSALAELRADRSVGPGLYLATSLKSDFYWQGDDLGPSDAGWLGPLDSWMLLTTTGAVLSPSLLGLRVGGEVVAQTDLVDYHPVSVAPEAILSIGPIDLKAAALVGLTDRADERRIRVEVTGRY